jgi:uncharacterized protein YacL
MGWIVEHFHIVLIVCGLATLTMLQFAIRPTQALKSTYGETLEGPLADVVVRTWGLLIGLFGGMLLWSAFHPETRTLVVVVAVITKLAYPALLLVHRDRLMKGFATVTVVVDLIMVVPLVAWLWATHAG